MSASQEDQEKSPELWEFLYYGRRSFADPTRIVILSPSGREDPAVRASLDGGEIVGYEASLYNPKKKDQSLVRYILEPSYQSTEELREEHMKDIRDSAFSHSSAKDGSDWKLDPQDGSLYYFLPQNHQLAYRLSVQDAAGGSRFYVFEKSYDAGESWEEINSDPFQGQAGQVEGMEFFTEDFGFIGIQGPSGDWSHLFVSWDGGNSFEKVLVPFDQVREGEVNTEPAESELSLSKLEEEFSYYRMPEKEGDQLLLTLTQEAQVDAGNTQLTFISKDQGRSWTYKKTN